MCKVKGSQELISKFFKKSHLVLAAVWPDKPINNVDHIDGDYYNNSVFNLDNVSRGQNSARKNLSVKGKEASEKSAHTRSHVYRMLNAARKVVGEFTIEEAHTYLVENKKTTAAKKTLRTHISNAALSGELRHGHYWEPVNLGPTRGALVDGDPLEIVKFKRLPDRYKKQIESVLGKGRSPPKEFSNYGEVMTNLNNWTKGNDPSERSPAPTRSACAKEMQTWMMLAFHKDRDEIDKLIEKKLEILHMDGDKNNPEKYHPLTHEDSDDSKPYTNYYFTLRLGTRAENRNDRLAKDNRKKRRLNSDIASLQAAPPPPPPVPVNVGPPPKPPRTALRCYMRNHVIELRRARPGASEAQLKNILTAMWAEAPESEKQEMARRSELDKVRYDYDAAKYQSLGGVLPAPSQAQ